MTQELAFDGRMSRETRRAVVTGLRDCEVAYLAIGTIEVNQPKVSAVEGYTVTVSITGEVLVWCMKWCGRVSEIPCIGRSTMSSLHHL